jgi:hypothetical protein
MGLGTSIFLIAVGAILRFAVSVSTHGFNVHTVGVILMIVGIVGLVISLFYLVAWTDRTRGGPGVTRRDRVVRDTELP